MATISDVARQAGVSIKTVSRVINQEPYVHETTRAKVLVAMRDLGFVANISAQRLASGRAHAIGFVFHNPSWQYINTALQGVLETGRADGYDTVIHPCDAADADDCRSILELVRRRSVDGFIFTPPSDVAANILVELAAARIPFVRMTPRDRSSPWPYVAAGDRQGAYEMTRCLLGLGHRRIGFVMGAEIQIASHDRLAGYQDALASYQVACEPAWLVQGDFSFESGVACGRTLLDAHVRPTAIFAGNDDMAAGVLAAAHSLGILVPQALSVAGFDNVPLSWQLWPALTTVEQPIYDIARMATQILIRGLRGEDAAAKHVELATRLIVRASTGPACL